MLFKFLTERASCCNERQALPEERLIVFIVYV